MTAAIHGIILAFGLILPLGAQNVFIFQQGAAAPSFFRVMPLVIAAAICDTLLVILAVAGVSAAVAGIPAVKLILLSGGFCFLMYMGWITWHAKPAAGEKRTDGMTVKQQIAFAAAVSLLNPHAILDIVGVIGTSSLAYDGAEKWLFTVACILVSWAWFAGLAAAGRVIRRMDRSGAALILFNKGSALIMWGLGLYLGASLWS
ncbi:MULTISPECIES: LysE/ArgO family amino acid transporter [Bacillus]|uniref:LysE/ArgO family amino acid transporter n=1 Tax=Bacillus TaxID=1386 RepID=UPI000409091B|nr:MULTISPECIES: LysE family transporter [Bacillus]QHZ46194.1 LysE family transporter [Bacillus sp. NSP9.1]